MTTPAKKKAPVDEDIDELAAYESADEDEPVGEKTADKTKDNETHATIHASSFRDFYLKPELFRAITDCGFEHPSEVQHECIPQAALGTDVLCQAKSGMGKTAVFVLSVLQQLEAAPAPGSVLVMCHTRELAYQINAEFERLKKYLPAVTSGVFYGGIPIATHKETLKASTPTIIIGTPGRILQLGTEKALNLKNVKHFVLDECDKMLETDMRRDVQAIFMLTPRDKQVMMFTATLSKEGRVVCEKFMHQPLKVIINDGGKLTLHGLQQYYVSIQEKEKLRRLIDLIDVLEFKQVIIFVRNTSRAKTLNGLLVESNFPAITLHAGMKQEQRIAMYKNFKEANPKSRIMVSTNIIGRGVDFERATIVINYDMPESADTYLHRVGRAGRFGTKGLSISFVTTEDDKKVLASVQQKFNVNIPEIPEEIDPASYMGS